MTVMIEAGCDYENASALLFAVWILWAVLILFF